MNDQHIRNAFDHAGVAILLINPQGEIAVCNPAANLLFGYESDGLLRHHVSDVLPIASPEDLNALVVPPARDIVVRGMKSLGKSGDPMQLAVHITPWTDSEHQLQHTLVLRDITAELEAESLAREKLTLSNNAVVGARIGVFEYDPTTDTVIVSDIWRELIELDPWETGNLQLEWRGRVNPEDLEAALEPMQLCLGDIVERASCEYRLRSKDGTNWRWMRTDLAIAKRDDDGKVIRVIGAMTDITERKNAENALRKSMEQFVSSFDNAPIGKAIVGLDGSFLRVNPALCDLFGYSEKELLTTDFQTLTHTDDLNKDLPKLDLLMAGTIPAYQIEKRYIRANGGLMWGLLSVGVVKDAEGCPEHFISQIVDVSERQRLIELKSEFVATVSHELRTPLTSVLGSLSLLSSMDAEPFSDEAQRLLYIALENGKRLHALVNDILDFEKFSAWNMRFHRSRQSIAGLIEESVMANLASADKFGVRFRVDCTDRSLQAFVDPKRFQQVMTNLLSNAAKFADKGSTIDVAAAGQDNSVRISVTNDGEGIPDAFRDQIFEPFTQAAPSATRKRNGTGLGLNITKQIVEQTGGSIGFNNEQSGKTTFWFTVPSGRGIESSPSVCAGTM